LVSLGDYPDGRYPVFREVVIVIGREYPHTVFEGIVVGLLILFVHVAPVALDVAIKGLLDELGKVGILAGQVVNPSRGDNLPGVENRVDYE